MGDKISFDLLSECARDNGFFLAGTTGLNPAGTNPQFINWIAAGYHGSMAYLQNNPGYEIRLNPEKLFPPARSIIFLGARYLKGTSPEESPPMTGIISSYAWGQDYHDVLRSRAQNLISDLSRRTGTPIQSRIAIDSAPVLEKPLAQRAGLGWQGRNTCLISPGIGSFYFIAGIFIDIDLDPTSAFEKDYCGTCRRCVTACPTGCILPDRTIDARRCISYLTIEHRGSIPPDLRSSMGSMLFGCDICQAVCPWNRKTGSTDVLEEFLPVNQWSVSPDLLQTLALNPIEFNRIYRQSPIKRAKRAGFLRNAALALGNLGIPEAIPALHVVMKTEVEPLIRSHAAWALGKINTAGARQILSDARKHETSEIVIAEIESILNT